MEEVQQFLEAAVRGSCEGLMVKALGGPGARYDIARRSHNWLKVPPPPPQTLQVLHCTPGTAVARAAAAPPRRNFKTNGRP